jgi:hypothetical protein
MVLVTLITLFAFATMAKTGLKKLRKLLDVTSSGAISVKVP